MLHVGYITSPKNMIKSVMQYEDTLLEMRFQLYFKKLFIIILVFEIILRWEAQINGERFFILTRHGWMWFIS